MSKKLLKGLLAFTLLLLSVSVAQGKDSIAVFQPDLRSPYEEVFRAIIGGIKKESDYKVVVKKISENYDPEKLKTWLEKKDVKAIVALGSRGLSAAKEIAGDRSVLAAASLVEPDPDFDNVGGISLAADPEFMLAELKRLSPSVKKVFLVYNPDINQWLIDLAAEAAALYDIELRAMPADDLRQAAIQYKSILNELESRKHALWLPLDPVTVENRTILPLILRVTWDRNLTLISSNAPHAKRGALFSTFPKNAEMGQSIAAKLNKWLQNGETKHAVIPLTDLGVAINVRTAAHLGIKLNKEDLMRYELKFPQN